MASVSTNVTCTHTPLCGACEALRDVDQEILQTISALQKLNLRRQEVVTSLNRSHDRVTRIPPEITSHIFYLYAHSSGANINVKGLFTIALVSKSWRDIVLSTPPLWTSITLPMYGRKWVFPYKIAETWLKRSGGLQVNITLRWTFEAVMYTDPRYVRAKIDQQFLRLLLLLQQHRNRMQHLHFQIPVDILPKLKFDLGPVQKFSLSLSNAITSGTSVQIPSGMKQITCLRIDAELSATNVLDLLRQCPLLVEWTSLVVRHRDMSVVLIPVEPMHLSNFEVDLDDTFPLFVVALTVPSLQRFTIKLTSRLPTTPALINLSYITDMIFRSPNLFDLSLQCIAPLARNQFTTLSTTLGRLPQLHSLSLTFDADYDEGWDPTSILFELFLVPKPGPPFLPFLQHFHYSTPRLQSWIPIAAFYKYHSTDAAVRALSVADFSRCGGLVSRGVIDHESLQVFLTLPTVGLSFKFNPKLLAMSIEHHGLPTPGDDVLSYYAGLEKSLEGVRTFRRRVLWHLNPNKSLNDTLQGSDAEMDQEHVSESAKVALHIYGQ